MSRANRLEWLGLGSEDWGPCFSDEFSHNEFAATWRGNVPCPSDEQLMAAAPLTPSKEVQITERNNMAHELDDDDEGVGPIAIRHSQVGGNESYITVDGLVLQGGLQNGVGGYQGYSVVVPGGSTYRVDGANSILSWHELR